MPHIKPFQGILYNSVKVSIGDVVAPPYDVISPPQQLNLYERSPFNVVRLILGREHDPYGSAAEYLQQWIEDKTLMMDLRPGIYIVSQEFSVPDGRRFERRGCIAACRLEEFGKGSIYPHEKTHSGPKEDRFKLFQATKLMFSQILGLYSDKGHLLDAHIVPVMSTLPLLDVTFEAVRNRLWRLEEEKSIYAIEEFMRAQRIVIADGHHRYETALQFRDACRTKNPAHTGKEPYNFVPMFFTNMHDPGLVILPTHRLVHGIPDFRPVRFLRELEKSFIISSPHLPDRLVQELAQMQRHSFGLFLSGEEQGHLVTLKDVSLLRYETGVPEIVRQLDVSVLHTLIFKKILGMTEEQQERKLHLDYEKEFQRAIDAVHERKAQAAFIMNATRIEQVQAVASLGEVMPQKSTYFYPKLLSGLVAYSFGS